MSIRSSAKTQWTPYPPLDALLADLLSGSRAILGQDFTGLYLHGSLALGDFDSLRSDVDFLVVTERPVPEERLPALAALHTRLRSAAEGTQWVDKLEGSYIPRGALRHFQPRRTGGIDDTVFPALRVDGSFELDWHGSEWILQSHVLRERGIVIAGPPPREFMDPRRPDELRHAVAALLSEWWQPQLEDPHLLADPAYCAYAVLTMCRMHYTLQHGALVSKPAAARWAVERLDGRWRGLIARAEAWLPGEALNDLDETLAFVRATLEYARRLVVNVSR